MSHRRVPSAHFFTSKPWHAVLRGPNYGGPEGSKEQMPNPQLQKPKHKQRSHRNKTFVLFGVVTFVFVL